MNTTKIIRQKNYRICFRFSQNQCIFYLKKTLEFFASSVFLVEMITKKVFVSIIFFSFFLATEVHFIKECIESIRDYEYEILP